MHYILFYVCTVFILKYHIIVFIYIIDNVFGDAVTEIVMGIYLRLPLPVL